MSYDEQPDGDPHGECAAEISRLEAEAAALRTMLNVYTLGGWPDVDRLSKDLADMRQQITFQARTNAEQAKLLNEVIAERDGLLAIVTGFHTKLATYTSVYPGDKELRRLLSECEAAIAKVKQ